MRTLLTLAAAAVLAGSPALAQQSTRPGQTVRPLQELERHHQDTRQAQQQQFEATQQRIQPPAPAETPPVRPGTTTPGIGGSNLCIGLC